MERSDIGQQAGITLEISHKYQRKTIKPQVNAMYDIEQRHCNTIQKNNNLLNLIELILTDINI